MSDSSPHFPELRRLLNALVDQKLDEAGRNRLRASLHEDNAARSVFCETIAMHSLLCMQYVSPLVLPSVSNQATKRPRKAILGLLAGAANVVCGSSLVTTLLVAIMVYGTFGIAVWQMSRYSSSSHETFEARSDFEGAGVSVARLLGTDNAQWEEMPEFQPDGASLLAGQRLRLASGVLQLKFGNGACTTVEGPCELELVSSQKALLRWGKLVALVPPPAIGFEVKTPIATVIDLGTEFGVEVERPGHTAVEVFQGQVRIETANSGGARSGVPSKAVIARAGENRRFVVDANQGTAVITQEDARPLEFKRSLDKRSQTPNAATSEAADELISVLKADKPLVVWQFVKAHKGIVRNAAGDREHGRLLGSPVQGGEFDGLGDYAEFHNLASGNFTLECRLKTNAPGQPDRRPWYGRALLWADVPFAGDDYALVLYGKRIVFCEGNTQETDPHVLFGKSNVVDGAWHHVALTRRRGEQQGLKLYVDGMLEAEADAQANELSASQLMFVGGAPDIEPSRFFQGAIDVIAVYDHALDKGTIAVHARAGKE